jgi:hypothetical protein
MDRTLGGSKDGVDAVRSETSLDHNNSNPDCSSFTGSPARNEEQRQVESEDEEKAAGSQG